jgi:hypothetical protein
MAIRIDAEMKPLLGADDLGLHGGLWPSSGMRSGKGGEIAHPFHRLCTCPQLYHTCGLWHVVPHESAAESLAATRTWSSSPPSPPPVACNVCATLQIPALLPSSCSHVFPAHVLLACRCLESWCLHCRCGIAAELLINICRDLFVRSNIHNYISLKMFPLGS